MRQVAATLFPHAERRVLECSAFRPVRPFRGVLFEILSAQPVGACVGILVPIALVEVEVPSAAGHALVAVADHVNLTLRGPLSGRWSGGTARAFPALTGVYQPAVVRARGGARVYSGGVVVAGVTDVGRLTPFEAGALREAGVFAVSDSLVPSAIIAAYYGLTLAACGVPSADDNHEE
ncbi:MAG TPA: hypothetical protein VFH61_03180 [Thermoleophilia bacterium]|nr:hypothetical protein [Thermoleophilia bacterium]